MSVPKWWKGSCPVEECGAPVPDEEIPEEHTGEIYRCTAGHTLVVRGTGDGSGRVEVEEFDVPPDGFVPPSEEFEPPSFFGRS